MASTTQPPKKIALVLSSIRKPRICPAVGKLVFEQLSHSLPAHMTLETIDLAEEKLPMGPIEPRLPAAEPNPPSSYAHASTRRWSETVLQYDGFVFVTPQYNWGVPAALKNAIDALFKEWAGKAAAVVSYGNRGGERCAAQLRTVCAGCRMRVVEKGVELPLRKVDGALEEAAEKGVLKEGVAEAWSDELKGLGELLDQMVTLLEQDVGRKKEHGEKKNAQEKV